MAIDIANAETLSRRLDVIPRQRALSQEALALLRTLRAFVSDTTVRRPGRRRKAGH